jgi:hypothetical protein
MRTALLVALAACSAPTEQPPVPTTGAVTGRLVVPAGLTGDAWVFLYQPGQGPPVSAAEPTFLTAVSSARLADDPRFVFAAVNPNPFRLWGLLDVDGNFDSRIDVLTQPSSGDRVSSAAQQINVQPGRGAQADLTLDALVPADPPAFVIEGAQGDLALDAPTAGLTTLNLVVNTLGRFSATKTAIEFGLVDADGDGRADDANGDGIPDLSVQVVLRWRPKPGQLAEGTVIVPVVYDPSPFLGVLQGRLGFSVRADHLQVALVPTAQLVTLDAQGKPSTTLVGSPPVGDYELILLVSGGQFWRLPNQLGATIASQAVRLHFDRP